MRNTDELARRLVSDELQVVIAPLPERVSGYRYEDLYVERHRLYCGRDHPFFGATDVKKTALESIDFVSRAYLERTDAEQISSKRIAATVSSMEAQTMLILSGHFVGFLPVHYANPWAEEGDLWAIDPDRFHSESQFVVAIKEMPRTPQVVDAFIETISRYASDR